MVSNMVWTRFFKTRLWFSETHICVFDAKYPALLDTGITNNDDDDGNINDNDNIIHNKTA